MIMHGIDYKMKYQVIEMLYMHEIVTFVHCIVTVIGTSNREHRSEYCRNKSER